MMALLNSGWIHSCPVGEYLASIACTCKQLDEVPHPPLFLQNFSYIHAEGYGWVWVSDFILITVQIHISDNFATVRYSFEAL